ncbi:MAG: hypothetical protein M1812_006994 [Candelaria pacifica]|nr:MAG: hypothetical protein M1812_006994 [Candelaria pacifica]
MVEKRKASTRARLELAKKPASTPPCDPSSIVAEPSESVGESLPTRLTDATPIPTLEEQQSEDLPSKEYQSIAESGILAASLQRSRHKWLSEGIFERYWTKPSKKKVQAEVRPNPSKDTMTKVGPCTITIEPHVFETTLYTIKEPQTQTPISNIGQSLQRPILQYGPPPPMPVNTAAGNIPIQPQPPQLHTQPPPPPPNTPLPSVHQPPVNGHSIKDAQLQQRPIQSQQATMPPNIPSTQGTPTSHSGSMSGPTQQQVPKPSPDPVIQMLATKAATDHELKALMRVVASGKASHPQLKVFQGHIDELTAILQSENNVQKATPSLLSTTSSAVNAGVGPSQNAARPSPHLAPSLGPQSPHIATPSHSTRKNPAAPPANVKAEVPLQPYSAPPPALKSKGPPPSARPDISAAAFEFSSGSGDRFLFPKYSILEYLPGATQVIVSFLVVRKGSASESGAYDPELDYYQPVTMRVTAQNAKVLEPLARVVVAPVEARKYMDDIMDNMTRAEYVHLAMRLPRDPDDVEEDEEEEETETHDQENGFQAAYSPPSSTGPSKRKVAKKASFAADDSSTEPGASPGPRDSTSKGNRRGLGEADKSCHICHTASTSLWRKAAIDGESVSVCNACGIKWKTNSVRSQEGSYKKARMQQKSKPSVAPQTSSISLPTYSTSLGSFGAANRSTPKSSDVDMNDAH